MSSFDLTLKNPVWYALDETHKKYHLSFHGVKFYDPQVCPFGAFEDPKNTKRALNEYAKLTDSFFIVSENIDPIFDENYVVLDRKIEGVQMVLENTLEPCEITEEIVPLTKEYIDEIYNLIWLVMPGYYKKRSFEMGAYFGILKDNKLVAVTGQRIQTNTFIELSGVVLLSNW